MLSVTSIIDYVMASGIFIKLCRAKHNYSSEAGVVCVCTPCFVKCVFSRVSPADESERGGRATMKVNLAVQIDRSTSKTHSDRLDALSCRAREVTGVALTAL